MSEVANKRNDFVDIMRGIAMLLVVLGHTMTGCTVNSEESFLFNVVWSLQMPLFILISGYVTRYSRGVTNSASLWKYIKRRTIAYLLPWAVWSFIVRGIIFGQYDFLNIKWLLWHMDSGYWFLFTIWMISMIFGLSQFVAKKMKIGPEPLWTFVLYVIGMFFLAGIGLVAGLSFLSIKLTLYYMPYFFAGYLYGQFGDKILEQKWGKALIDAVVAVCTAAWLFIIVRYHIYTLPDGGMAIVLRAMSSLTGCIAACGLCHGVFAYAPKSLGGGITTSGNALLGDIPDTLSTAESATDGKTSGNGNTSVNRHNGSELRIDNQPGDGGYHTSEHKQTMQIDSVWQNRVRGFLHWAGIHSLEIYMLHGLVLNILKMQSAPAFTSIPGIVLTFSNYLVSIALCWIVIRLVRGNKQLRKMLSFK